MNVESLFHYTKSDSAIKILESQSFKFGKLINTNDPFEKLLNRVNFNADPKKEYVNYWGGLCDFFDSEITIGCFGENDEKVSP